MEKNNYTVFIQSNEKQYLGALLAKHSIISNSRRSSEFKVEIMIVEQNSEMMSYDNKTYYKSGQPDKWEKSDLQSFTLTRFLPPQLMNFQGKAVVIDPDVFATKNTEIMDLFEMEMNGKAILACKSGPTAHKSSVMLLDCEKLKHWQWDTILKNIFSGAVDYREWMRLQLEPAESIGTLPDEWNHCDTLNEKTKLIHYTIRLTQPWKTGLPVDFKYDSPDARFKFIPRKLYNRIKSVLKKDFDYHTTYQQNPHQTQTQLFFQIAKQALEDGAITKQQINENIKNKHIRGDFLQATNHYN